MIELPFSYKNKNYSVTWSDEKLIKFFAFCQHGKFMLNKSESDFSIDDFSLIYPGVISNRLDFFEPVFDQLPANATVLNVGAGVGTLELVLSRVYNWKFYLVDKTSTSVLTKRNIKYYGSDGDDHGFYNSWEVLKDGIKSSGIDSDRFVMLNPDDEWPNRVDLIMSSYSWGWHYPLNVYWDRALRLLSPETKVMLDILNTEHTEETIEEINRIVGKVPVERFYTVTDTSRFKDQHMLRNGNSHGSNYYW